MRGWTLGLAVAAAMATGLYAGLAIFASEPTPAVGTQAGPAVSAGPRTMSALRAGVVGQVSAVTVHDAPREVPPATFLDPTGAEVDFSAYRGQVVLVNFWATWCAPCRREMPSINRLAGELEGDGFRVVAISLDRGGPAKPAAFLDEIAADRLALYRDPSNQIARDLQIRGLPVTLILDRSGREVARLLGHAEWDAPEAVALLRTLIEG